MKQDKETKAVPQMQRLAQGVLFATTFSILVGAGGCPQSGVAPAAPPPAGPFAFTASTTSVNIAQNTLSPDVEFRVTSNGTFEGQVVVSWQATGDCSPSPSTNDVTLSVAPGAPAIFKRKMYRWSANGRNLRWTATHAASNTTRTLDVAFTH
jgi:hypothetical protein